MTIKPNEKAAKVNVETGEITVYERRKNNIPEGKIRFEQKGDFKKSYSKSWMYFKDRVSPIEFKVAFEMSLRAKRNTNSLEPIGAETTVRELAEMFSVSKSSMDRIMKVLFNYGVYAEFNVKDDRKPYTHFFIFNPYLSFDGKIIDSDIPSLFVGTKIARYYLYDIPY